MVILQHAPRATHLVAVLAAVVIERVDHALDDGGHGGDLEGGASSNTAVNGVLLLQVGRVAYVTRQ